MEISDYKCFHPTMWYQPMIHDPMIDRKMYKAYYHCKKAYKFMKFMMKHHYYWGHPDPSDSPDPIRPPRPIRPPTPFVPRPIGPPEPVVPPYWIYSIDI